MTQACPQRLNTHMDGKLLYYEQNLNCSHEMLSVRTRRSGNALVNKQVISQCTREQYSGYLLNPVLLGGTECLTWLGKL
jgi:hypothetical protein